MKWWPHILFLIFVILCFVLDLNFDQQNLEFILQTPSFEFLLGTDELGRDLLTRLMWGARISLIVSFCSTVLALIFGVFIGLISAWCGGVVDRVLMRGIDVFISLPNLVLLIILQSFVTPVLLISFDGPFKTVLSMIFSLSLVSWVNFAKVSRQQALQDLKKPFVESAKSSGAGVFWILTKHIMPLQWVSLVSLFIYKMSSNILYESFLSFLGMGINPPYSSWGNLLNSGWNQFPLHLHTMMAPAGAIFLVIFYLQWTSKKIIRRPQVRFY